MNIFPFMHFSARVNAPPNKVFEAISQDVEPVRFWLNQYTDRPFFGQVAFPNARVQISRFSTRWVVINFHISEDQENQCVLTIDIQLPDLAKFILCMAAAICVLVAVWMTARTNGHSGLLAIVFPLLVFLGARSSMLSDFNASKTACEVLQQKLNSEFPELAPNHHIGPDQTASGLAGHPER